MKRLLGLLVVLIPVSLFVAGCGGSGGGKAGNPTGSMKPDEMKKPADMAKSVKK
jgi:hypothetical protein